MNRERFISWLVSLVLHGAGLLVASLIVFERPVQPFRFIEVEIIKIKPESALATPVKTPQKIIQKIKRPNLAEKKIAANISQKELPHKPYKELLYKEDKKEQTTHIPERIETTKIDQSPSPPAIGEIRGGDTLVYATVTPTTTAEVPALVPFSIKGPLGVREILYQPKPKLPSRFELEGIKPGEIRLKLWVLPSGQVDKILVLRSSGYGEWDAVVVATAQRWRFASLPPNLSRIDWGEVSIKTIMR